MGDLEAISSKELVDALNALGVRFFQADGEIPQLVREDPREILIALAGSNEARLRVALIPLILEYPDFSDAVIPAAQSLSGNALLTLRCYYTAAVWLSRIAKHSKNLLPDLFSGDLGLLPTADPNDNLTSLAQRQKELSGSPINWLGTYYHAVRWWKKSQGHKQDAG